MSDKESKNNYRRHSAILTSRPSLRTISQLPTYLSHTSTPLPGKVHTKCRSKTYCMNDKQFKRFQFIDDKVSWDTVFEDYPKRILDLDKQVDSRRCSESSMTSDSNELMQSISNESGLYTNSDFDEQIENKENAGETLNLNELMQTISKGPDPRKTSGISFNKFCRLTNVNRISHHGRYKVFGGRPLNIVGRTGIKGRGLLHRWGPNHGATLLFTRWKETNGFCDKTVVEFYAEKKNDTEWTLPERTCEGTEEPFGILKNEYLKIVENLVPPEARSEEKLNKLFDKASIIYKGYVDDPRNTDNAWVETVVYNFHDESGTLFTIIDESKVKWFNATEFNVELYANHSDFVKSANELHIPKKTKRPTI